MEQSLTFIGRGLDDIPHRLRTNWSWYRQHIAQDRCWYCEGRFYMGCEYVQVFVGIMGETHACELHVVCAAHLVNNRTQ